MKGWWDYYQHVPSPRSSSANWNLASRNNNNERVHTYCRSSNKKVKRGKLGNQINRVVCNPLWPSISAFKKFEEGWFTISVPYLMWSYWTHSTILSSSGICLCWVVSLSLEDHESYKWMRCIDINKTQVRSQPQPCSWPLLWEWVQNTTLKEVTHSHDWIITLWLYWFTVDFSRSTSII